MFLVLFRLTLQVTDVFLCPIRKTRSVLRAQKNVVEQKPTKGAARLGFCGTRAAEQAVSCYRLLSDVGFLQFLNNIFFICADFESLHNSTTYLAEYTSISEQAKKYYLFFIAYIISSIYSFRLIFFIKSIAFKPVKYIISKYIRVI